MPKEPELFRKARDGDIKAVEEICSATWKPLYRFVFYKTGNREEAEDITQETYARALSGRHGNNFEPDRYIGFLKTIALNILRDRWRQSKRRGAVASLDLVSPEETAARDETEDALGRDRIIRALNGLKQEQRTVVVLRLIQGYSVSETAKRMSKKEITVRVLQHRALRALAEILGNRLEKGDD